MSGAVPVCASRHALALSKCRADDGVDCPSCGALADCGCAPVVDPREIDEPFPRTVPVVEDT